MKLALKELVDVTESTTNLVRLKVAISYLILLNRFGISLLSFLEVFAHALCQQYPQSALPTNPP